MQDPTEMERHPNLRRIYKSVYMTWSVIDWKRMHPIIPENLWPVDYYCFAVDKYQGFYRYKLYMEFYTGVSIAEMGRHLLSIKPTLALDASRDNVHQVICGANQTAVAHWSADPETLSKVYDHILEN